MSNTFTHPSTADVGGAVNHAGDGAATGDADVVMHPADNQQGVQSGGVCSFGPRVCTSRRFKAITCVYNACSCIHTGRCCSGIHVRHGAAIHWGDMC